MKPQFDEKTLQKALLHSYVDARRLLANPAQMQKFLLRLDGKMETVRPVEKPLAAAPVFAALARRYAAGEYDAIPADDMACVVSALLYFVSPWDLFPDSIPGQGYDDDAAVLDYCWKLYQDKLEAFLAWEEREKQPGPGETKLPE